MTRFNVSVLLATALLGVLLWIVLSIVKELAQAPDELLPMPVDEPELVLDPSLPRLNNSDDLKTFLSDYGVPATELLAGGRDWLEQRGFPTSKQSLLPAAPANTTIDYADIDDVMLLALAGEGNIEAMHELAERSLESDPLAALEWYDQAIISGSLYAMERTADLLVTLSDPAINEFVSDAVWQDALVQIIGASPAPIERALAWSIAMVTAGGYAVMSPPHASRLELLSLKLDAAGIERACETAQGYVLEAAAVRRSRGGSVFSMQAPPLAVSISQPATAIPCDVPVPPLVSLDNCAANEIVGPGSELLTVWVCPY